MDKFKLIFNYYLSTYANSSRTVSSMYSFLKIFFERNNKSSSTVASFGNVFRNSKWGNFQTQNIKKSFTKQWLFFFLFTSFILYLVVVYSSIGWSYTYLNAVLIKHTITDYATNFFYCVGCLIYKLFSKVYSTLIRNQVKTIKVNTPQGTSNHLHTVYPSTSNNTAYYQSNLNLFFLQKTLPSFERFTSKDYEKFYQVNTFSILPTFKSKVSLASLNYTLYTSDQQILNTETPFLLSKDLQPQLSQVKTTSTTLNSVLHNKSLFDYDSMLSEKLIQGLNNMSKQQRWLTRNFWSNQNLAKESSKITESKKSIQDPILNSSLADTNIWVANKFGNLEIEQSMAFAGKLTSNHNILSNFNFFTSSRFYLDRRYTFLNQLANQLTTNQSIINLSNQTTNKPNLNISLKSELMHSYFSRNLDQNLQLYLNNIVTGGKSTLKLRSPSHSLRNNVFVTTKLNDFLHHNDLQTLNSINSATNASSLQLHTNFSSRNFKS